MTGKPNGERQRFAAALFNGIAENYELPARLLSLGQYERWQRFLVSRLDVGPGSRVLDVATGTGLVAQKAKEATGCDVVGIDVSTRMLGKARARLGPEVQLLLGDAEELPFADDSFDAVVFTYLLRYVDDLGSTVRELARVLRPGGVLASLEFSVPRGPVLYPLWLAHTRVVMPLSGLLLGTGWLRVMRFLGPSISRFERHYPMPALTLAWQRAGVRQISVQRLSLGGATVMWGRKQQPS